MKSITQKRNKVQLVADLNKMHSKAAKSGDFQTQQGVEQQMQSLGTYPGDPMAKKRKTMFQGGGKFNF